MRSRGGPFQRGTCWLPRSVFRHPRIHKIQTQFLHGPEKPVTHGWATCGCTTSSMATGDLWSFSMEGQALSRSPLPHSFVIFPALDF
jgi:hypothetical protein